MTEACSEIFNKTFRTQANNPGIIATIYIGYTTLGIIGTVLNFLIIYTIWKIPTLHKPSYVLLASLALGDMVVGLLVDPLYAVMNEAVLERNAKVFCEAFISGRLVGYYLGTVSLYSLTLISIDRLFAIKLKKKYRTVVTLKRVILILVLGWVGTSISFIILRIKLSSISHRVLTIVALIAMFIMLATITVAYSMSFYLLKHLNKVSPNNASMRATEQASSFNASRYRRSLKTMVIVFLTMIICYSCIFWCSLAALILLKKCPNNSKVLKNIYIILTTGETIVLLNSTFNPLIYFWRMKDLYDGVKQVIKSMYTCNGQGTVEDIQPYETKRAETTFSNT